MHDDNLWQFELKFIILSVIRENEMSWFLKLMERIECTDKTTITQKSYVFKSGA